MNRNVAVVIAVIVLILGVGIGMFAGSLVMDGGGQVAALATPTTGPGTTGVPSPAATPTVSPGSPSAPPTASPSPTPEPTPTPAPTPVLVPAPLTGMPVKPALAKRHVIAVMIDDQAAARPQSGLSDASVVWQAPAEGGIPRYMALFQEGDPPSVGPIRSARLYYIAWAAEWRSVYAHAGGSPQAISLLATKAGRGQMVYNADALRRGDKLMYRVKFRFAPHNVYSTSKNLRKVGKKVGAKSYEKVPEAVWKFAPDAPLEQRPQGTKLTVPYLANRINYSYDRKTNRYLRSVTGEGKEIDRGTKERIAPKNVIVMLMSFRPLGDKKHRLEAQVTGSGRAWISTNGKTIKGTWRKKSFTSPTRFYDADGNPVTLTQGQTFVQVVPRNTKITIKNGKVPAPSPSASPGVSPTPAP